MPISNTILQQLARRGASRGDEVQRQQQEAQQTAQRERDERLTQARQQIADSVASGEGVTAQSLLALAQAQEPSRVGSPERPIDVREMLRAQADTALSMGTGAAAAIGGGFEAGVLAASGYPEVAQNVFHRRVQQWTYEPRSDAGQQTVEKIGEIFETVDQPIRDMAFGLAGGNPKVATAIYTAIWSAPELIGLGRGVPNRLRANRAAKEIQDQLDRLGVDLRSPDVRAQISEAAALRTGTKKGEALGDIGSPVQQARDAARAEVQALFDTAREGNSFIMSRKLRPAIRGAEADLQQRGLTRQYMAETMPVVNTVLKRLEDTIHPTTRQATGDELLRAQHGQRVPGLDLETGLVGRQRDRRTQITRLQEIYDGAGKALSETRRSQQDMALNVVRDHIKNFMDDMFNNDMVRGDPANIQAWKNARKGWAEYKKTFDENRVLRQLAEADSTADIYSKWILGVSSMGAKMEAAAVVRNLNNIFGPDSPQMGAVRAEFMYDVVRPLLQDSPDLKAFVRNYDTVISKHDGLVQALDIPGTDLGRLRDLAKAVQDQNLGVQGLQSFMARNRVFHVISRATLGNQLAKATLRQNMARNVMESIAGQGESAQRAALRQMYAREGFDPSAPLVDRTSLAFGGLVAAELSELINPEPERQDLTAPQALWGRIADGWNFLMRGGD